MLMVEGRLLKTILGSTTLNRYFSPNHEKEELLRVFLRSPKDKGIDPDRTNPQVWEGLLRIFRSPKDERIDRTRALCKKEGLGIYLSSPMEEGTDRA